MPKTTKMTPRMKAFRKFFRKMLKEYNTTKLSSLSSKEKSDFFTRLKKDWKKESKGLPKAKLSANLIAAYVLDEIK